VHSALRFGVLGPVCAWRDGHELDLGPVKQRAVLAMLLLRPNRPVTPSEIVDAVWGDEPPANGANVVQKHVSGLRRIFEPERPPRVPGQLLSLTDAGYLLRVEPGQLDADEFRAHLHRAGTARQAGQPGEALPALRTALALWRGAALAGLPGAFFEAERSRLAEIHVNALEDVLAVELTLGRHASVIPELLRLVAEFPLRERLRYLLMLAFVQSGRQAEALAVYRDAHRFLADELGIEPNDELRTLQRRILMAEVPPVPAEVPPVLAEVPPVPPSPAYPVAGPSPDGRSPLTALVSGPSRPSVWYRLGILWLVVVPFLSVGFLSWLASAYAAVRLRSWRLAVATGSYFAAFIAVGLFSHRPATPVEDDVIAIIMLILWFAGTAQGFWVRAQLIGPRARRIDPAAVDILARQVRRQQAYQLLTHHPVVAREVGIGRPDQPRHFDDGGLVDVNAVPERILAALPGITSDQAGRIVAARQYAGLFASVDDLVSRGLLPRPVVDSLRDTLIAVPDDPAQTAVVTGRGWRHPWRRPARRPYRWRRAGRQDLAPYVD
jgi:DNA-binding SARP family transcriptional activator